MTGLVGPAGDGHTEVPEEQRADLLPTYIATLAELYEAEQANIATATARLRVPTDRLLDDGYLRRLHRAMFEQVWRWAGRMRRHDTNIGVPWTQVPVALRDLVDDARTWVEVGTFEPDELAIRFHHRLEQIHPFANGNGRHGRLAADLLVEGLGRPRFTWGAGLALDTPALRAAYLAALRRMDGDREASEALVAFART